MAFNRRLARLVLLLMLLALPVVTAATPPPAPPAPGTPQENLYKPRPDIFLLQPLGENTTVANNGTIQVAFDYFNDVWPYIYGSAAGIGVIWAMIAGVLIMFSGENSELRSKAKDHLIAVSAGLVLIALSGLVLTTLNSIFFQ